MHVYACKCVAGGLHVCRHVHTYERPVEQCVCVPVYGRGVQACAVGGHLSGTGQVDMLWPGAPWGVRWPKQP